MAGEVVSVGAGESAGEDDAGGEGGGEVGVVLSVVELSEAAVEDAAVDCAVGSTVADGVGVGQVQVDVVASQVPYALRHPLSVEVSPSVAGSSVKSSLVKGSVRIRPSGTPTIVGIEARGLGRSSSVIQAWVRM